MYMLRCCQCVCVCVCVWCVVQVGGGPLDSEHLFSTSPHTKSLPQPIGRPERTSSASSDNFQRAVGAEVKSKSLEDEGQVQVQHHLSTVLQCLLAHLIHARQIITRASIITCVLQYCVSRVLV